VSFLPASVEKCCFIKSIIASDFRFDDESAMVVWFLRERNELLLLLVVELEWINDFASFFGNLYL